jgi:hypothetical protein
MESLYWIDLFILCFLIIWIPYICDAKKSFWHLVITWAAIIGIFMCSGLYGDYSGRKYGAYKQLRGEYEITYVINSDSCVIDTIINFN